jgi:uncharacterized protein (DUF1800 family)
MNRRTFLKLLGSTAVIATPTGTPILHALASPDLPTALRSPVSTAAKDPATHLLNRLSFGARPGQAEAVRKMGMATYIEQQLNPMSLNDATERLLGDLITLDMTPAEMFAAGKTPRELVYELDAATVLRAVHSERQLFEVMVNFWSEHFSIFHQKENCEYFKTIDDREVIRPHALGKFRDLLGASAKSPAMLIYLDNADSRKEHPNENYARELMELHTLTIGHYSEQDVKEVARCFTGWTVRGRRERDQIGTFVFRAPYHDDGQKTVLGRTIPAGGGITDGEMVLDMVAAHPATARHIASKLCRRFIADDPPATVVEAATQVFLSSGGDIKQTLRVIFAAPEFLNAPPKFKRPFEFMIGLARAFDMQFRMPLRPVILQTLKNMGHLPFDWITPDGYSDYARDWIGDMLPRWNLAITAAQGQWRAGKTDALKLAYEQGAAKTGRGVFDFYAQHLLGRPLDTAELDVIWGYATKNGEPSPNNATGRRLLLDTIALIAASPAYQYR